MDAVISLKQPKKQVNIKDRKGGGVRTRCKKSETTQYDLLFKWLWRYNLDSSEAWKKLISGIHGKKDD